LPDSFWEDQVNSSVNVLLRDRWVTTGLREEMPVVSSRRPGDARELKIPGIHPGKQMQR
jgi:hypothetical protein